jgi:cytochrome c6
VSRRSSIGVGAVVVALLVVGVALSVASATATEPAEITEGRELFVTTGCGSCHVLGDAGTRGIVGPNLDRLQPSEADVRRVVTDGAPGMPSFAGRRTPEEIDQLAAYVARRSR